MQVDKRVVNSEQGFTLPEVLITVLLIGIVAAIAVPSWFSILESRKVDSATNQVVADMRLAHTRATNQLRNWAIVTPSELGGVAPPGLVGPGDYYVVDVRSPITSSVVTPRQLPEGTQIDAAFGVIFAPDGSAQLTPGSPPTDLTVSSDDGDTTSGPSHVISYTSATSRVRVDP